jgi:predicted amidophosphoribosyltransferase
VTKPTPLPCEPGWSVCHKCHAEVRSDQRYCASCGVRMKSAGIRYYNKPKGYHESR